MTSQISGFIPFFMALLSFALILASFLIKTLVFYHFKKFGLPEDPNVKKILNLFTIVGFLLVGLNLFFLLLNLI